MACESGEHQVTYILSFIMQRLKWKDKDNSISSSFLLLFFSFCPKRARMSECVSKRNETHKKRKKKLKWKRWRLSLILWFMLKCMHFCKVKRHRCVRIIKMLQTKMMMMVMGRKIILNAPRELNDVMKVHFTWTFEQIHELQQKCTVQTC